MFEEGNKEAEKWTKELAIELFDDAIALTKGNEFDFIGEVAKAQNTYIDLYDYLVEKFPDLRHKKTELKRNCEAACFANGKKGRINTAMAIVNLKSNHGWTDRNNIVESNDITVSTKNE